jgi:hypothetical protein
MYCRLSCLLLPAWHSINYQTYINPCRHGCNVKQRSLHGAKCNGSVKQVLSKGEAGRVSQAPVCPLLFVLTTFSLQHICSLFCDFFSFSVQTAPDNLCAAFFSNIHSIKKSQLLFHSSMLCNGRKTHRKR